jgi:hypothetical protein
MPLYPESCLRRSQGKSAQKKVNLKDLRSTSKNFFINNNPGEFNSNFFPSSAAPSKQPQPLPKKRVTFAPDTASHDREAKPYKV